MTTSDNNQNVASWQDDLQDWIDEAEKEEAGFSASKMTDEFVKAEIHPAVVVTPKTGENKRWVPFSLVEYGGLEPAKTAAVNYLVNEIGESVVAGFRGRNLHTIGVDIRKHIDGFLDRDTGDWSWAPEDGIIHDVYIKRNDLVGGEWKPVNWDAVWNPIGSKLDSENVLNGRWGTPLWVHIRKVPDKTFIFDDPSTWTKWNSEEYTNTDGEEKVAPRRIHVLTAAFDTKEELVTYATAKGISLEMVDNMGADSVPVWVPTEEYLSQLNTDTNGWETTYWPEIAEQLSNAALVGDPTKIIQKIVYSYALGEDDDTGARESFNEYVQRYITPSKQATEDLAKEIFGD